MAKHTLKILRCEHGKIFLKILRCEHARFLKYVWPFYNMRERVNSISQNKFASKTVVTKHPLIFKKKLPIQKLLFLTVKNINVHVYVINPFRPVYFRKLY